MRFMAARSIHDARKAAGVMLLVLMPIAACVVASGGWVGKALVHAGVLPADLKADEAFYVAAEFLSRPGVFGLIMAALTAALMSTVDTLITAVSAVVVNDFYKPYINRGASERSLLRAARVTSVSVALLGVLLVPVFMNFKTIYAAHGAMTAAVTPPLVVTLLCSVFWRRFTRVAALATLIGGMSAIVLSIFVPDVIAPFAHGVPKADVGDGLFDGMKQFKFMRACYGLAVSGTIAVVVTLLTKPESAERCRGLVWGTVGDAIRRYKGSAGSERRGRRALAMPLRGASERIHESTGQALVRISRGLADALEAGPGDLLYVSDRRSWLGGLNSAHAIVDSIMEDEGTETIELSTTIWDSVIKGNRKEEPLRIERMYV
jgi:Na+/proline symporter